MRKELVPGLILAAALSACGADRDDKRIAVTPEAGSGAIVVSAQGLAFNVDRIQVTAGASTTVILRNEDAVRHTLTVYLGEQAEGAPIAGTGDVAPGASGEATVLFTSGQHAFRCEVHPDKMSGMIVVP